MLPGSFRRGGTCLRLAFLSLELARGACDALGQAVILPLPPGLPLRRAARHKPRFLSAFLKMHAPQIGKLQFSSGPVHTLNKLCAWCDTRPHHA